MTAEEGNPSAALVSGWLRRRLGVDIATTSSAGPGVTEVEVTLDDGGRIAINRPDGRAATLCRTGQPDRKLPLARRDLGDLLAEELRRLEHDGPYAEALATATGLTEDLLRSRQSAATSGVTRPNRRRRRQRASDDRAAPQRHRPPRRRPARRRCRGPARHPAG